MGERPINFKRLAGIERMIQPLCGAIDEMLKEELKVRTGFCLLVFDFEGPETSYGSNANREDMIKALREAADTLEKGRDSAPGTGAGEFHG